MLAMTTANDDANGSKFVRVFRCFTNKMVIFGVVFQFFKNKVINLSYQDLLTDPYVTSRAEKPS